MPLYEEKLISPLAIRFTQNRIRTTFRDDREVESTIRELAASLGDSDYDVIIEAPFPAIEIIRWSPGGRKEGAQEHWFTFDNRRLYCLQRFAVECWPKRVAAKVEVMYADSGGIRKKLDTQSLGSKVNIGHAFAVGDELIEWSWRQAVQARAPPGVFAMKCEDYIAVDDAKRSIHDLADVPKETRWPIDSEVASTTSENNEKLVLPAYGNDVQHEQDRVIPSSHEGESLTSLIGKLLTLKEEPCNSTENTTLQRGRRMSSDTDSTHISSGPVSESADSVGSDDEIKVGPYSPGPSLQEAAPPTMAGRMGQKSVGKKAQKKKQTPKVAQNGCPSNAASQAAQIAQYQMAHQVAQWQMACAAAQWQQAAMAFPGRQRHVLF
jgi:hypothetical protein